MSFDQPTATQTSNFRDTIRYSLYAKVEGARGNSRLMWSSYKGMPRITIFTGVDGDAERGILNVPLSYEVVMALLDDLKTMANSGQPGEKKHISVFINNRSPDGGFEKVSMGDVHYGKNAEGVTWIAVIKPSRPEIIFEFMSSPNVIFHDQNGSVTPRGVTSTAYVNGAVEYLKHFYQVACPDERNNNAKQPTAFHGASVAAPGGFTQSTFTGPAATPAPAPTPTPAPVAPAAPTNTQPPAVEADADIPF